MTVGGDGPDPVVLEGVRHRDGAATPVAVELHQRLSPSEWRVRALTGGEFRIGDRLEFGDQSNQVCLLGTLHGTVAGTREDGDLIVAFEFTGPALDQMIAALID